MIKCLFILDGSRTTDLFYGKMMKRSKSIMMLLQAARQETNV